MDPLERNRHGDENEEHTTGRGHVHDSTRESCDNESNDGSVQQTPARVGEVDAGSGVGGCVSHHVEEDPGVVTDQGVTGKLGEETDEDADEHTAAHAAGLDEF